ncbi:hypothetical protein GCM10009037_02010 [Halarchaeum grantii]|uniref:Gamma-glutamyl:cysteine ligase YbdK, ATP-grasp superfamily n=1 Tax=Halarchaeum grantii TaxID=1193105 RepID=A0A830F5U9_9EURY|nr:hypothetical protein [Halarchaeum grantii]GGL22266.1 hypothetical protein GCM10009037_02010 [Halarchaeum grantii]
MAESELARDVESVLDVDPEAFQERVREDADVIKAEIEAGTFDNPQAIVGLEYEFYGVSDDGSLARIPRRLLEFVGFEKELGLHNAEMTASPQPLNEFGLEAQEAEVRARLEAAAEPMDAEGLHLVSDAMWTIPPEGETAREYLTASVTDSGVEIATNMSASTRYHAMANTDEPAGMVLDAPHVSLDADTVMPEALITSIQPHYQVPQAVDLPTYFRYAVRLAGPLVALGVNSPFYPPDLYDAEASPAAILEEGHDEARIDVFESVLNVPGEQEKVRFPRDFESVQDAVDAVVEDDTIVPMPVETGGRFDDEFAHFRMKHGTYWRWVRPVFGGSSKESANARIEFRPLPGQPTVRDTMAFQALLAGSLEAMVARDHPLYDLPWETARENFYAAVRDGSDAELTYLGPDGETTDATEMYTDLFEQAEAGLRARGLDEETAAKYLWPLRQRARHGITPADWKRERVRENLDDGASFENAVYDMQFDYLEHQRDTLITGSFADWTGRGGEVEAANHRSNRRG